MVEQASTHVKQVPWARRTSQGGAQELVTRVSKNLRQRSQSDTDFWNRLFDTQDGPIARISSLST
jgi:hypothetical protein